MRVVKPLCCRFDRVDIADEVGDRHVGGRKFFAESRIPLNPFDLCRVAVFCNCVRPKFAHRSEGIIVDLASLNDWDVFV